MDRSLGGGVKGQVVDIPTCRAMDRPMADHSE